VVRAGSSGGTRSSANWTNCSRARSRANRPGCARPALSPRRHGSVFQHRARFGRERKRPEQHLDRAAPPPSGTVDVVRVAGQGCGWSRHAGFLPHTIWNDWPCPQTVSTATNLPETTKGRRGQATYIDAAHRVHARVEDGIRTGKDTRIGKFPSHSLP
jgi:hypothetical protein